MYNSLGKTVPVVLVCLCGKQHWAVPKKGNCVECHEPLPVAEKDTSLEKPPGVSIHAKQTCDMLKSADDPAETQPEKEARLHQVTLNQAMLDQATANGSDQDLMEMPKSKV